MIVNFRNRGISRGAHKLARTPTLIKKKKKIQNLFYILFSHSKA
jgi:hypothetical protein